MNCLFCKNNLDQLFENKRGRKYCSNNCKIKNNQITKICPICNLEFITFKKKNLQLTYCSKQCNKTGSYKDLTNEESLHRLSIMLNKNIIKTEDCWIWTGPKNKFGYGKLSWKSKDISAHRASYLVHNGKLPKNLFVCHTCDIRLCVNPKHLFIGTHTENMQDMIKKGRGNPAKHNNHPNRKITLDIAREIKELSKSGEYSQREIAEKYNISPSNVGFIKNNKTWKE